MEQAPEDSLFTNIVPMGIGEPLFNYDNVAKVSILSWTARARYL
jgi:adenine C2-methylase RlmN of 23S rRNA A2503 and tRNA A37